MAQATIKQATGVAPAAPTKALPVFRYAHNVYFQDGVALTAILAGLLYLVLGVGLDAAGHVTEGMGVVVPVTLGAIALGVLLSFSRFDSFFALSHSLFAGLAWILFLMSRLPKADEIAPFLDKNVSELQAGGYLVLLRLIGWVDAAVNRSASADNYVFIFEICFLIWWLAFLGMWSILRFGYVWRAVVPAGLVMVINTYYAPQPVWVLLGLFSALSLFLLIRTNLSEQQLRWRDQHVHVSHDLGWDFVRTGLTYTLIVLTITWLAPGLGRNSQIRQMLAPINEQWEETSQELNRLYQGLNRRQEPTSAAFGRNLTLGGPRNVGDTIIFSVKAGAGRYWRAVTFDTYTGLGWTNTANQQAAVPALQPVPIGSWSERAPLTQTITLMANTGNVVFGAPDIRQLNMSVDAVVSGVPALPLDAPALGEELPAAVEFSMVRARETLDIGDEYTVLSNATAVSVRALQAAGEDYPAEIVDRYVQMPENFSPEVAGLAQSLVISATTPYEKARAVESFLRTIPYNDAIAAPPPGADPIEYFLFDIQQGYCDYYATSMAMMLRSLGIPSRTASGYAEGTYDEESDRFLVTERDAHTWVEVFFPGLGWVEFEPTAGESPLDRPEGTEDPSATVAQPNQPTPPPFSEESPPNNEAQQDPGEAFAESGESTMASRVPWWVWAILTPLLLIVGMVIVWRVRVMGPTAFTPDLPILLFERLQRWAARLGLAPQAHETPLEQARGWSVALPQGEPPIRRITDSYVRYRFSRRADERAAAEAAVPGVAGEDAQAWQTLEPMLWRAWLRRLIPWKPKPAADVYRLQEQGTLPPGESDNKPNGSRGGK